MKIVPMVCFCSVPTHFLYWALAPTHFVIFIKGLFILLFSFMNKVDFSLSVKGCCVYMINKIKHSCLWIWIYSSHVQLDISLIHCIHLWAIDLNTQRKIPYLCTALYYILWMNCKAFTILSDNSSQKLWKISIAYQQRHSNFPRRKENQRKKNQNLCIQWLW